MIVFTKANIKCIGVKNYRLGWNTEKVITRNERDSRSWDEWAYFFFIHAQLVRCPKKMPN